MYDTIVVPTDGSEHALRAAEHGLALARAFDDERSRPRRRRRAGRGGRFDAGVEVREGLPVNDLLSYADAEGIDLIAMGARGRTGLDRLLVGSTAERVVRHADVPVVTVPLAGRTAE